MASYYSEHGKLREQTLNAYRQWGANPSCTADRVNFYRTYLEDVVPNGVTVLHIHPDQQLHNIHRTSRQGRGGRQEIQLWYEGKIFMTSIVSLDPNPAFPQELIAILAHTYWRQGRSVDDPHQAWGVFTALRYLNFYSSQDGQGCVRVASFHPITGVRDVVAYLRQCYQRIRLQ